MMLLLLLLLLRRGGTNFVVSHAHLDITSRNEMTFDTLIAHMNE